MDNIHDYLAIGFTPSAAPAHHYLEDLIGGERGTDAPQHLLRRIIHERMQQQGDRSLTIPLTGGMDSRSILGAALDVVEAKDIHCLTAGPEQLRDCRIAARTCQRVGVTHERIDPDTLTWDVKRLEGLAQRTFAATGSRVPLDTLVIFNAVAAAVGNMPVLSGYLGDAVSGKHLPVGSDPAAVEMAVGTFLYRNNPLPFLNASKAARDVVGAVAVDWSPVAANLPGATCYDVLDFGFRQGQRIRAETMGLFPNAFAPFEDRRWVAHWLSRPLSDREDQSAYVREMQLAFPAVFTDPATPMFGLRRMVRRWLPDRIRKARSTRVRQPRWDRGDPRRNPSMAAAMDELIRSFDQRGIVAPVLPRWQRLLAHPTGEDARLASWATSAELHIRAGNFT